MKASSRILVILSITLATCTIDELRTVNDQSLITTINNSGSTWEAGVNERFKDINLKTLKRMLGVIPTPPRLKQRMIKNETTQDLPENFDLREQWPQCSALREVRDQSNCGSCWAFAAAEAMSDRICIHSKGNLQTRISTENLLSCCRMCGDGCNGGMPSVAWDYFRSHGIPTGGLYGDKSTCQPYKFKPCDHHVEGRYGPCGDIEYETPTCSHQCIPEYKRKFQDDLWYSESSYAVESNEEAIKTEIYKNGSVGGAFTVYEDFPNYKSGVYQHVTGQELGGHAIKVIGWGGENGVKYWLCVNSWNEGWGDKGTFKILRGSNHCGIEEEIVAGIPKIKREEVLSFLE